MNKQIYSLLIVLAAMIMTSCNGQKDTANESARMIKVGVFKGHGGAATCIREAYAACLIDPEMEVSYLTPDDIARGNLVDLDAFIIPGGGGSTEYLDMGESNRRALSDFVENGGTLFGICAGAYMLSNTPDYACMKMIGAKAIDIEHDNRGHGICKVTLTDAGKEIFPEVANRDTLYLMYYEGPVFVPENENEAPKYNTLAMMMSDVHVEGNAPANMTNNKPFFTSTKVGKGHVISSVGHPEATPGMQWMVPRFIRWAMGKELVKYNDVIVNPNKFNAEILCTDSVAAREKQIYKDLLYASPEVKIAGIQYLDSVCSWSGKNWVRGLLYEDNVDVQMAAARYMNNTGYTSFYDDVTEAVRMQKDPVVQQKLQRLCDSLEMLIQGKGL